MSKRNSNQGFKNSEQANTPNGKVDVLTPFTKQQISNIGKWEKALAVAITASEKSAEAIASNLFLLEKIEAHKLHEQKSFNEYAMSMFGLAKGTISDSLNTYKRFGKVDGTGIKEEYKGFKFSTLMRIKSLSDEQIKALGITASTTKAEAQKLAIEAKGGVGENGKGVPKEGGKKSISQNERAKDTTLHSLARQVSTLTGKSLEDIGKELQADNKVDSEGKFNLKEYDNIKSHFDSIIEAESSKIPTGLSMFEGSLTLELRDFILEDSTYDSTAIWNVLYTGIQQYGKVVVRA